LKDLCNKGLIPAGEYVINISWWNHEHWTL
jgi:hypothetical protein